MNKIKNSCMRHSLVMEINSPRKDRTSESMCLDVLQHILSRYNEVTKSLAPKSQALCGT